MRSFHARSRWILLCLLLLSAGLYLGTAGTPALDDDDVDAAHAMVSQEMLQRHNFIVPYMDGIRYLIRPPMHYWLVAASYKVLGQNEFATRLPLAVAMIGMVLLTFEFGRRFFGQRAGLYAALAVATSAGMFIFTRVMIPEAIYALAFEGIFYLFLRSWSGCLDTRIGYWGAAALCGVAVMTRALIGVLFPATAIIAYITITGSWRRWRELRPFSSAATFLAVAAPWHIWAAWRTPGFIWAYFVNEHINRALGTRLPHDYGAVPVGIWLSSHLIWLFPWSFFFPLALRKAPIFPRAWREAKTATEQARLLLFVWAATILGFFTLESGSRMEYYSFGAWPAIAMLIGYGIAQAEEADQFWLKMFQRFLAGVAVVFAAVAGYVILGSLKIQAAADVASHLALRSPEKYVTSMAHVLDLTPQSAADLRIPLVISSLSIFVAFLLAWLWRERGISWYPNFAMAAGMVGFFVAANMAYGVLSPTLSSRTLAHELSGVLKPGDQIALFGDIRVAPGIAFYAHRNVLLYDASESNLQYGSRYTDAPKRFFNDRDFSNLWQSNSRVFLVVPDEHLQEVRNLLPKNSVWEFADTGGKAVYMNQPMEPGSPDTRLSEVRTNSPELSK